MSVYLFQNSSKLIILIPLRHFSLSLSLSLSLSHHFGKTSANSIGSTTQIHLADINPEIKRPRDLAIQLIRPCDYRNTMVPG